MSGVVHEARIEPERDVVQENPAVDHTDVDATFLAVAKGVEHGNWIVAVEVEVSGKVVPGPERDAHEGNIVLERLTSHGRERPVSPRHPECRSARVGMFTGNRGEIVARAEHVGVDPSALGFCHQLLGRRLIVSRPWIDDQEGTTRSRD